MLPASPRRQEVSSVHPQRYQGFDSTFAQGIILYYIPGTPEAICQKCIVRTGQLFLADSGSGTPKKLVVVAVVHHISWATGRVGPSKHVGGLMGMVDVVVLVNSTPHLMSSGPGRPVKTHGPPNVPGGAAHIEPTSNGPQPARPVKFRQDGP